MEKSKELSQKLRKEVIFCHSQGYGFKTIAKTLNISRDTFGSIVRKYKAIKVQWPHYQVVADEKNCHQQPGGS